MDLKSKGRRQGLRLSCINMQTATDYRYCLLILLNFHSLGSYVYQAVESSIMLDKSGASMYDNLDPYHDA